MRVLLVESNPASLYTSLRFAEMFPEDQVRFGPYHANLRTAELRKHGRKIRLVGRPFQILALLLERPGDLVTRQELRSRLWPSDCFVDFEHGVNTAIQTLRRALCDSHKKPRFVETLPRRGYRFIGLVEKVTPASADSTQLDAPRVHAQEQSNAGPGPRPNWVGEVATVRAEKGRNFVLLPINEEVFSEMCDCEAAKDDLGISLMVSDQKLLLVNSGTRVKILNASHVGQGCTVRILGGHFVGEKAFAPRRYLFGLS